MVKTFRDQWLDDYYFGGKKSADIPSSLSGLTDRSEVKSDRLPADEIEALLGNRQ